MVQFTYYSFAELSASQIYAVLKLRAEVFVVDQQCVYLDPDGRDSAALHLLGIEQDKLVSYLRLFPPTDNQRDVIFGRVVTAKIVRGKGYGKKLIEELLIHCANQFPGSTIKCSAQYYLLRFYEEFGFKIKGDVYDEEGIPHIAMVK